MTSGAESRPRLSVVIPVYNERENVEPLVEELTAELSRIDAAYEVLLVDDGSTDGSREVMDRLVGEAPCLRVLHLDGNHGQSAAFGVGFRAARGEYIVTLDADLQNDPADISRLLEWIPRFDMVAGYRRRRNDAWLRRISSRVANGIRALVLRDGIRDTGCSLKLFRADLAKTMPVFNGMHRFLPALLQMQGGTVTQLAVNHRPRRAGDSKYGVRNRLGRGILDMSGVWWLKRRAVRPRVSWTATSPDLPKERSDASIPEDER